jgi:hypothetical protein
MDFNCLTVVFNVALLQKVCMNVRQRPTAALQEPPAFRHKSMFCYSHHALSPSAWSINFVDVHRNVQPAKSRSKSLPGVQCLYRHFCSIELRLRETISELLVRSSEDAKLAEECTKY